MSPSTNDSSTPPGETGLDETDLGSHFEFGTNWRRFLSVVDESRVAAAEQSLRDFLSLDQESLPLAGQTFLDAGCGSGLFSLAASRLGAVVMSFDFDPQSVACAEELRRRFASNDAPWQIQTGSALDHDFLRALGQFDIVYSWGVLHHTGAMWDAMGLVSECVAKGGLFFVAIYNDQGQLSDIWRGIKKTYVALPAMLRRPYVVVIGFAYYGARAAMAAGRIIGHALVGRPPNASTQSETAPQRDETHYGPRGMSRWYDLVDWVGGYPFEATTPDALVDFLSDRSFQLTRLRTVGGKLGCNEFLFRRAATSQMS